MTLEELYNAAWAGADHPNMAVLNIPAMGIVELYRGQPIIVNGREGTWVEWHMIRGWLNQMKCNHELKWRYGLVKGLGWLRVVPSPISPPAEGDALIPNTTLSYPT